MPLSDQLAELDRRYRARLEAATLELRRSFEQRLRAATEELAAALAEVRATPAESLLAAADFEPIAGEARREGERAALDALLECALAFDAAGSQVALLDALLDGARRFVPRAAVLITEGDGARGWGAAGFGDDAERFAERRADWAGEALAAFAAGEGVVRARGAAAAELAAGLALPVAEEGVLVPLVLRDRVAAALYADRRAGEPELSVTALQLVALGAAERLELQPFTTRAATPTLHAAGAAPLPGLPLWDPSALGEPEPVGAEALPAEAPPAPAPLAAAPEPAVEPPPAPEAAPAREPSVEVAPPPAVEPAAAEAWADEAAGAVFELEPESPEPEAAPAAEVAPAFEGISKSGIEELFEAEEPRPAPPPVAPEPPAWTGPEVVSWAQPEPAAPAAPPPSDSWSARDVVSWTAPEPPPAPVEAPPPVAAPAPAAADWEMEEAEGEATVFIGGAPRGAATSEIAVPETTAPIPTLAPPPAATVAVPTLAVPITPDLTEDATLLVARPSLAPPPAAAPPPAPVEPAEDQTHPSLRTPPPSAEEDLNERTAVRAARGTEVAPPPDLQGPGLAFTMSRTQRASGENALHEEARRLARLLISEIKLYNEEQVEEGRRHRDLYLRLKEDIDRSRQIYDERVHDSVRGTADYFQQELIRSLAGGDPRALGM